MTKYHKNGVVTLYSVLLLWECGKAVPLSFLPRFHVHDAYLHAVKVWYLQCTLLTATVLEGLKHFRISASLYVDFSRMGEEGAKLLETINTLGPILPLSMLV